MSMQVERLEELLARVQRNRRRPGAGGVTAPSPEARPGTAAAPSPREPEPHRARTQATGAAQEAARPVVPPQTAAEEHLTQASAKPAAAPGAARRPEPEPAPAELRPERIPAAAARPTGGVVQVVRGHPKLEELTFGELLRRSLALRTR